MLESRSTAMSRDKPLPRYREVAAELTEEIRRGVYPPGALLPTEVELGLRFAAGRHTVRDALRIVSEQGLIKRRAGLGCAIRPRPGARRSARPRSRQTGPSPPC
jgi:DNA-binding GntR family transcriptional regulator